MYGIAVRQINAVLALGSTGIGFLMIALGGILWRIANWWARLTTRGTATFLGPIAGASIVVIMKNVVSSYIERWNLMLGVIFAAIIRFMPEWLMPGPVRLRRVGWQVQRSRGAAAMLRAQREASQHPTADRSGCSGRTSPASRAVAGRISAWPGPTRSSRCSRATPSCAMSRWHCSGSRHCAGIRWSGSTVSTPCATRPNGRSPG